MALMHQSIPMGLQAALEDDKKKPGDAGLFL
jgi:hypothetical protein